MSALPQAAVDAAMKSAEAGYGVAAKAAAGQIQYAFEAAAPHIAAAAAAVERERLAAGTGCITPCDDDCELQPDGCHELHQIPRKRTHLPQFCADIRAAIGAAAAAERERIHKRLADRWPGTSDEVIAALIGGQP